MPKAKLVLRTKLVYPDGAIREVVIWQLPVATPDRPYGLKYRCYCGSAAGKCLVRYDNESGKGGHVHVGVVEHGYVFESVEQLLADFEGDVSRVRKANK
jgi:hypothetical protein